MSQSSSFPAHSCLRVLFLPFFTFVAADPRPRGVAERRETSSLDTCRASDARCHACEAWALPRNREARLTALRRGVVGPGPPSRPGHDGRADAKAPRPPGIAARLRCRALRIRGYHPRATPHPTPPSGSSPDDAPHERDFALVALARDVVNNIFITYS